MKLNNHRIPSLDGLRALSIAFVLLGHGGNSIPGLHLPAPVAAVVVNSQLGVFIFFVISGFLITRLLLQEKLKTGSISIKQFYIRRAFRIWPAFYMLVVAVLLLGLLKLIPLRTGEVVAAALYFWNYYPGGNTWFLAHTWSLAIEEQFYFLWPVILRFASKRRGIQIAAGVIGLSPLVRVATYALFPHLRSHIPIMFHTRADSLMFGAAAALLYEDPTFQRLAQKCFRWHLHLLAALFVFVIGPQVELHLRGAYTLPIGWTLNGVAVVVVLVWAVQHESTLIGRLLNSRFIVHVGATSYSIYLWQEVFLAPSGTFAFKFPLNFLLAFVAAELSYRCVEQPFLRMRSHLAARRSQEQLIEKTRSLGVAIG